MGWNRALFLAQPLWTSETVFQALEKKHIPPETWNGINPSRGDCRGQARHCEKTICRDLKNYFFGTALVKLIDARLCKKKNQALFFFRMPLVKSANSTSLPRLSSSKLRRCIQHITKSALRIWGTLDLLWWKFACIKNKEYEGPWASSFRINQLSGCIYWSYVHQLSYHQNQLINPLNLHMFLGISSPFSHGFPASPRAKLGASPSVPSPRHGRPVVRIISTFQPQLVTVVDQRTPGPCELKNLRKLSGLEIRVVFFHMASETKDDWWWKFEHQN